MKVTHHCYPTGKEIKQNVVCALKKGVTNWFVEKLDSERLEEQMAQRKPLSGAEYQALLDKMTDLLIDINAHLESGSRYYNALFDR